MREGKFVPGRFKWEERGLIGIDQWDELKHGKKTRTLEHRKGAAPALSYQGFWKL